MANGWLRVGDWSWRFRVNVQKGWRQRVAECLHVLASRIDGRLYLAIDMQGTPSLTKRQIAELCNLGMKHTERLLQEEVVVMAQEEVMRRCMPSLYEDRQHGQ